MKFPKWAWYAIALLAVLAVVSHVGGVSPLQTCPGSQVYCPGVGCVSGKDKCVTGSRGGPSKVFSKEGFEVMKPKAWNTDWAPTSPPMFTSWPGEGVGSTPALYGSKESFTNKGSVPDDTPLFGSTTPMKKCPDNTRSPDTCLMEFPSF